MPSVEENLNQWSDHDWSSAGDEWSVGYGGTGAMWAWTILPRIAALLPSEHILDHVEFHLNDGTSLAMIEDDSIDVVLSWDSLIHVEDDVLSGYLTQLATRLRPGGVGFFTIPTSPNTGGGAPGGSLSQTSTGARRVSRLAPRYRPRSGRTDRAAR